MHIAKKILLLIIPFLLTVIVITTLSFHTNNIRFIYQQSFVPSASKKKEAPLNTVQKKEETENLFGRLIIPQIKVERNIYSKNSIHNSVDKNIMLMKESTTPVQKNGNVILAAHSGTGHLAYFKDLDKLKINEKIYFQYQNRKYTYKITYIEEHPKTGTLKIQRNRKKSVITLITCQKNSTEKQLVIIAEQENL